MAEVEMVSRTGLIAEIAEDMGTSRARVKDFFEFLEDAVLYEIQENSRGVNLGFIKVFPATVKARMARNPQTGEPIKVKAHKTVKARVMPSLKNSVR